MGVGLRTLSSSLAPAACPWDMERGPAHSGGHQDTPAHSTAFPTGVVLEQSQGPRCYSSMLGLALSAQCERQARGPAILTPALPGTPAPHRSKSGTDPGERERRTHEPGPSPVQEKGRVGG